VRLLLVFGPEKRGLTREDLALCHFLVEIPTDARQPSMNLGQAVAVCLYALAAPRIEPGPRVAYPGSAASNLSGSRSQTNSPATAHDLGLLSETIAQTLVAANYSPANMRSANRRDLHLLLHRLALSQSDARRILGLFRRILWKLEHRISPPPSA
jgi:tRNA C32,U32 (ribose-2'-O)-methylase TrmJ